jgi:phage-related protein
MNKAQELTQLAEESMDELRQLATSSQKSQYQALKKSIDSKEAEKAKLLDQLGKESDGDKRADIQKRLHAVRDEITKLDAKRSEMNKKYRGLRSK